MTSKVKNGLNYNIFDQKCVNILKKSNKSKEKNVFVIYTGYQIQGLPVILFWIFHFYFFVKNAWWLIGSTLKEWLYFNKNNMFEFSLKN